MFFADGNTTIDAPHIHEQYDFDGDTDSNLFELAAGTCLWSVTEPCIHPAFADSDTNNILLNGDFSNGTDKWWSTESLGEVVDGEYCMSVLPSEYTTRDDWHMGQASDFSLKTNTEYSLSFYARSQTLAEMRVSLQLPESNLEQMFSADVEVFSTFNQYSYRFDTSNRDYEQTRFVFKFDAEMDNSYCFDDLVLKEIVEE